MQLVPRTYFDGVDRILVLHRVVDAQVLHVQICLGECVSRRSMAVENLRRGDIREHLRGVDRQHRLVDHDVEVARANALDERARLLEARVDRHLDLLQDAIGQTHERLRRVDRTRQVQHRIGEQEHVADHVLDALRDAVRVHLLEERVARVKQLVAERQANGSARTRW